MMATNELIGRLTHAADDYSAMLEKPGFRPSRSMLEDCRNLIRQAHDALTPPEDRPLTAKALADAFDCVWNAVIGAAHDRGTGMDTACIIAETFSAVANGLREAGGK